MSADFTDLEIYIRPAKSSDGVKSVHDVEATIAGAGLWRNEATFDQSALGELDDQPEAYGELLGRQLFFGEGGIARAYQRALGKGRTVRIRLKLDADADERHLFRWERLFVPTGGINEPICTAPATPFTRYIPREDLALSVPESGAFQLLFVIANPVGLPGSLSPIEVEQELITLVKAFGGMTDRFQFRLSVMPGRTGVTPETRKALQEAGFRIIDGPATLLQAGLEGQHADGLHFICHGKYDRPAKTGNLYLEKDDGSVDRVSDHALAGLATGSLKLIYLQACESGARNNDGAMVGLAAQLVAANVPAVIGMQQPAEMEDAQAMTRAFYQALVKDGAVDAAANAGRRAIWLKQRDGWHVPALYMSLRDGRLWHADVFSSVIAQQIATWEAAHDMAAPLPLQAAKEQGTAAAPTAGAFAQAFQPQAVQLAAQHVLAPDALVLLTGPRGAGKTAILDMLAWNLGRAFLAKESALLPIRLTLAGMGGRSDILKYLAEQWREQYPTAGNASDLAAELAKRQLLLLIDGEEDLVAAHRNTFIRALIELRKKYGVRALISVDEFSERHWLKCDERKDWDPVVLRTKPMVQAQITRYLSDQAATSPELAGVAQRIQSSRCWDLAGETWLLRRMIRYPSGWRTRAEIYQRVAEEQFESLAVSGLTRSCLEKALMSIAWDMQCRQSTTLAGSALYQIFADARGARDVRLEEIKTTLTTQCRFLRPSGEDGVRFSFAGMQAYYAARHLQQSPHRQRSIEDIVARLGRLKYLREWQETLVVLAGLLGPDFEDVLIEILASSSGIGSGEQVYLAARCYLECNDDQQGFSILDLLVDTLIWRAHPNNDLPLSDRKKAIRWLSEMNLDDDRKSRGPDHDPDRALRLLVDLACAAVSRDWNGTARYEFNGMRLEALNVLLAHPQRVAKFVLSMPDEARKNPLVELVGAWQRLAGEKPDPEPILHVLRRGNADQSPLAVFALGLSGHAVAAETLIAAYADPRMNAEVQWAIAEMLPRLDPQKALQLVRAQDLTKPDARIVYMINRVGVAEPGSPERQYLEFCLQSGQPRVAGRVLRTFAEMGETYVKDVCERIVRGDWRGLRETGLVRLTQDPASDDAQSLQHAALEGLRTIGDQHSIEILQKAWLKLSPTLSQLCYSVAEEIYWRLREQESALRNRS